MIIANSIKLFESLSQGYFDGVYYDLHNDYSCSKVLLEQKSLILDFIRSDQSMISLKFNNVDVVSLDFFNDSTVEYITIDNLYRGRFLKNESLIDMKEDERCYFYLEFYEGQKIEFWAESLSTILNRVTLDIDI